MINFSINYYTTQIERNDYREMILFTFIASDSCTVGVHTRGATKWKRLNYTRLYVFGISRGYIFRPLSSWTSASVPMDLWGYINVSIIRIIILPSGHSPRASYVMSSFAEKQSCSSITWTSAGPSPECKTFHNSHILPSSAKCLTIQNSAISIHAWLDVQNFPTLIFHTNPDV